MFERYSLRWPITLGVIMIVLLVALAVGWVLLAVFGALGDRQLAGLYWTLLTVGSLFLLILLVGVVIYLALTVKAVNLQRRQSNFIDSVTHELKSPIASLKLYLQTLNRHRVGAEQQEQFLRDMLEDVERLDRLINHLLEAARLDRRPAPHEFDDVDLVELLQACSQEVRMRYRVPPETVQLKLTPARIRAPRMDLDLIFRNLIDNAVKYSGDPPQVEVELQVSPSRLVSVTISDNGRGIPLHLRRKIFGRFVRLGFELERDKPGIGLGLYLAETMVRRLHGRIRVRDRGTAAGTIFEVQLPGETVCGAAAREAPAASVTAPGPSAAT